jgi:hypothetical protein
MVAIGVYDPLAPVIFFVLLPMMRSFSLDAQFIRIQVPEFNN